MDTNEQTPSSKQDVQENKDIAALSYAWVLSVFVYFAKRDSAFVRFHARQGIVLFVISLVIWMIPYVRRPLELVVLALAVIGFLAAAQGQWKKLPIVYGLSRGKFSAIREGWKELVHGVAGFVQGFKNDSTDTSDQDPGDLPSADSQQESLISQMPSEGDANIENNDTLPEDPKDPSVSAS